MRYEETVYTFEKNILENLKGMSIIQARAMGVKIRLIKMGGGVASSYVELGKLESNISKWISKNNVIRGMESECKTYTISGTKGRQWHEKRYFSKFKLLTQTDDGYLDYLQFVMLDKSDIKKYGHDPDEYSYYTYPVFKRTPSLLQIVYGLLKKYPDLKFEVYGIVPGIVEPSTEELEKWKYYKNLMYP